MNILMTGANGLIGSRFLEYFKKHQKGDRIFILSRSPIEGYTVIKYDNNYKFSKDNFSALDSIDALLILGAHIEKKEEAHLVRNHLKSISSVDYLLNNLPIKPKKVVYCSSVAVYGFNEATKYVPTDELISEKTEINPCRAYALSKVFCEKLVEEWCNENGVELQILRIGAVYDYQVRYLNRYGFIFYMFKAYLQNDVFNVLAAPTQKWNYVYVKDVCKWLYNALYLKECPGILNLTSVANLTTMQLLNALKEVDNGFQYTIPSSVEYKGIDKAFDSSKRKMYLGEEDYSVKDVINKLVLEKKV